MISNIEAFRIVYLPLRRRRFWIFFQNFKCLCQPPRLVRSAFPSGFELPRYPPVACWGERFIFFQSVIFWNSLMYIHFKSLHLLRFDSLFLIKALMVNALRIGQLLSHFQGSIYWKGALFWPHFLSLLKNGEFLLRSSRPTTTTTVSRKSCR